VPKLQVDFSNIFLSPPSATELKNYFSDAWVAFDYKNEVMIPRHSSFGRCRDGFLLTVHNSFADGADTVGCALFFEERHGKNLKEVLNLKNNYYLWQKTKMLSPTTLKSPAKFQITREFPFEIKIEDVNINDITTTPALIFSISRNDYLDPALFWLITEEIRKTLTGYSKVSGSYEVEYKEVAYTNLVSMLKSSSWYVPASSKGRIYHRSDYLLSYHSPLNYIIQLRALQKNVFNLNFKNNKTDFRNLLQHYEHQISEFNNVHCNINIPVDGIYASGVKNVFTYIKESLNK